MEKYPVSTGITTKQKLPWYANIFVMWIALTAIYLFLIFNKETFIGTKLGLFVPVGLQNFWFSYVGIPCLSIIICIILLPFYEFICSKLNISSLKKILLNIAFLFILTMLVDFSTFYQWCSWKIAIHQDYTSCHVFDLTPPF